MCGVINTGMRLTNTVWNINIYFAFDLQLNFQEFYLPSTKDCSMAKLIIRPVFYWSLALTYCGKPASWEIAFMESSLTLQLLSTNIFGEFFFILTYEAIDFTLTQMQFVHFVLGDRRTIALTHSPYGDDV